MTPNRFYYIEHVATSDRLVGAARTGGFRPPEVPQETNVEPFGLLPLCDLRQTSRSVLSACDPQAGVRRAAEPRSYP